MNSSSSTEKFRPPNPNAAELVMWSPTSATQGLSNPGSFPASESNPASPRQKPPQMVPGHAFEVQVFNGASSVISHSNPVLAVSDSSLPPMKRLFLRIDANDREFVRQLPALRSKQMKLGIFLDEPDPVSGRTPLTAALLRGHLDLAADLLLLGADPQLADARERVPVEIAGKDSMGAMVLQFMSLQQMHGVPHITGSKAERDFQQLLTKIDSHTGHTLLTWAISRRHHELVEQLLEGGPDFRVYNRFVRTALEEACASGSLEVVVLLLDAWPTLVSNMNRRYLTDAIRVAAESNRPMVLAQLLSFFRTEFRLRKVDQDKELDENPLDKCSSDRSTQNEVYRSFLGVSPEKQPTIEKIMRRTHDNFLLTADESRLLRLNEIVAFAKEKRLQKIVEIIHAHARLPVDE